MYNYEVSLDVIRQAAIPTAAFIAFEIAPEIGDTVVSDPLDIINTWGSAESGPFNYSFPWGVTGNDGPDTLWPDPIGTNIIRAIVHDINMVPIYTVERTHVLQSTGNATLTAVELYQNNTLPPYGYVPYDSPTGGFATFLAVQATGLYPQGLFGEVIMEGFSDIPSIQFVNQYKFYTAQNIGYRSFYPEINTNSIWTPVPGAYHVGVRLINPNGGPVHTQQIPVTLFRGIFVYNGMGNSISLVTGADVTNAATNIPVWNILASQEARTDVTLSFQLLSGPQGTIGDINLSHFTNSWSDVLYPTVQDWTTYYQHATPNWLTPTGSYLFKMTASSNGYTSSDTAEVLIQSSGYQVFDQDNFYFLFIEPDPRTGQTYPGQWAWYTNLTWYQNHYYHAFPIQLTSGQTLEVKIVGDQEGSSPLLTISTATTLKTATFTRNANIASLTFTADTTDLYIIGTAVDTSYTWSGSTLYGFFMSVGVNSAAPEPNVTPSLPFQPTPISYGTVNHFTDLSLGSRYVASQKKDPFNTGATWQIGDFLEFIGTTGDVISIRYLMYKGELQLFDPDGILLQDITGPVVNDTVRLTDYTLPKNGTYTIIASFWGTFGPTRGWAYSLDLTKL